MANDKTKNLKGNGHINVSNVNAMNSECITLTYTVWNFKNDRQVAEVRQAIYDLVDDQVTFGKETKDWTGDEEKVKLKVKIRSCKNEKKAHTIKSEIDQYIKKKGGQTTLDESAVEEEDN